MKDLLMSILNQIVSKPEDLSVDEKQMSENSIQYMIHANQEDVGKIIGRDGKIIQAIRNVMKVPAVKNGKQVYLEIV